MYVVITTEAPTLIVDAEIYNILTVWFLFK